VRQKTRRKYWARSAVASYLRGAADELEQAIQLAGQPQPETPLSAALQKVIKTLQMAIDNEKAYQLGRKRIKQALEREKRAVEHLLQEVKGVPVTKEEKLSKKIPKGGKNVDGRSIKV